MRRNLPDGWPLQGTWNTYGVHIVKKLKIWLRLSRKESASGRGNMYTGSLKKWLKKKEVQEHIETEKIMDYALDVENL